MHNKILNEIKDIDDLMEIYYGPNKDGRNVPVEKIIKHNDAIRTAILSPQREKQVEQLFAPLGDVKRVSRAQSKTSDFVIEKEKLKVEATSLNTSVIGKQDSMGNIPLNLPADETKLIKRVNKGLEHAEEKEDYVGYGRIAVLHLDVCMYALGDHRIKKLLDPSFIKRTQFLTGPFDALLILPDAAGGIEMPAPICYAKTTEMATLLCKIKGLKPTILSQ